ncbi:MAG: hypothetical protein K2Y18_01740 [Alphaproteobacteria bacterium]|jgi:hypothetical protein|nr:hypothetical protein [Alphaproteobacteria bacterium]
MKKLFKWTLPALLGIMPVQAIDLDNLTPLEATEHTPLTPRTSTFRSFVGEVAEEEGNHNVSFVADINPQGAKYRVLKVDSPINGNVILGYFPPETKPLAMRTFLKEVSEGTVPVTFAEEADAEGKLSRIIIDEANQRSLLVEFKLPEVVAAIPNELVVAKKDEKKVGHFEILGKRLDGFTAKAKVDADTQGKRLEGFVKNEVRPTVEQEAHNAGKALEKAGQNIKRAFKKL